ncbi:hypothetical protein K490DRAFT_54611 [Saccharata proteae CBS 121410]|uniref:Uncharacterized protein n=1 Tax=Saccharata proteae CBS 121410 TaxID=1314787 RepID=A0A9P4I0Z2_9PEZI|nr:hypothetical protein K490DRAFT_54611 [Saccharata proteae CBS 121410]
MPSGRLSELLGSRSDKRLCSKSSSVLHRTVLRVDCLWFQLPARKVRAHARSTEEELCRQRVRHTSEAFATRNSGVPPKAGAPSSAWVSLVVNRTVLPWLDAGTSLDLDTASSNILDLRITDICCNTSSTGKLGHVRQELLAPTRLRRQTSLYEKLDKTAHPPSKDTSDASERGPRNWARQVHACWPAPPCRPAGLIVDSITLTEKDVIVLANGFRALNVGSVNEARTNGLKKEANEKDVLVLANGFRAWSVGSVEANEKDIIILAKGFRALNVGSVNDVRTVGLSRQANGNGGGINSHADPPPEPQCQHESGSGQC